MANQKYSKRGDSLEYLVAAVFQGQGYLVRRSIPLREDGRGQDATDIDVLGFRFAPPLQQHIVICDCKDKQRPKPYERLFWTKGLSNFVNASDTYVALPKASLEIINFAKEGGVRVLTRDILQSAEQELNAAGRHPYGSANPTFFEPFAARIGRALQQKQYAREIEMRAKLLYLSDDPYVALNRVMIELQDCADQLQLYLEDRSRADFDMWRYLAAELTVLTALIFLRIAADTMSLSRIERHSHIMNKLTYGSLPKRKTEELMQKASELVQEAIKSTGNQAAATHFASLELFKVNAPRYAQNAAGIVERIISSPDIYHETPQLVDFLLFEQALQNRVFSAEHYQHTFAVAQPQLRLKAARNIFAFIRDSVSPVFNSAFWPNQKTDTDKD